MKIAFKRTFARDLRKIPTKQRETIEKFVFDSALKAESLDDLAPIVSRSRLESGQAVEKPVYVALIATGLECQSRVAADLFE